MIFFFFFFFFCIKEIFCVLFLDLRRGEKCEPFLLLLWCFQFLFFSFSLSLSFLLLDPWNWVVRLKVASDIASGMAHLHSLFPPVLHRDLKVKKGEGKRGKEKKEFIILFLFSPFSDFHFIDCKYSHDKRSN